MDFESSVQRLAKDQSRMRGKLRSGAGGRPVVVSEKAKRQAEYQRKQAEKKRLERERQKKQDEYQKKYMRQCERTLKTRALLSAASGPASLVLSPTSIYGEGDKIALPPSVLETLTQSAMSSSMDQSSMGSPWTFRIGILNPDYQFPSSILVKTLKPPKEDDDDDDFNMGGDSDDEMDEADEMEAFQDELKHKYLAYTHCTVVEFTQDEGHVGIPQMVAKALLARNNANANANFNANSNNVNNSKEGNDSPPIPVKRTVDPASASRDEEQYEMSPADQTPGHLAWGAFDIPDLPLEITLLQLPKGKGCTLVPTQQAIQNNFYALKDVKLVLEQSLIRTRATLSKGDVVCTWHRGVQFDLKVTKVVPATYDAITCINTDIEVDIGEAEQPMDGSVPSAMNTDNNANTTTTASSSGSSGQSMTSITTESSAPIGGFTTGGQTLGGSSTPPAETNAPVTPAAPMEIDLLPEPPADIKQGVCTVHIQHSRGTGKRRFVVAEATMKDLFAFCQHTLASSSATGGQTSSNFRLVTRFPRKVWDLTAENSSQSLADAGIAAGQERFMVEFL